MKHSSATRKIKSPKRRSSPITLLVGLVVVVAVRGLLLLPSNADAPHPSHLGGIPLTPGVERPQTNETIVFVHVGKTGGETIQWRIKLSCNLRKSKRKKARCVEQFESGESLLSRSTIGYLHCNKLKPRRILDNATMLMFSVRDPVDRIVSWFQYMHPQNCLPDRPSGACNLKKDNNPWGEAFYQTCFPDVNDFVRSLSQPTSRGDVDCSTLAHKTVQGKGPEGPTNHMFYNYFYYTNRTLGSIGSTWGKSVVTVRQESLWYDLHQIEGLLGGQSSYPFEEGPKITHGSEHFLYRASLDETLVPVLCCSIRLEILAYVALLKAAKNIDTEQRDISLNSLFEKCKATSLTSLSSRCGWNQISQHRPGI